MLQGSRSWWNWRTLSHNIFLNIFLGWRSDLQTSGWCFLLWSWAVYHSTEYARAVGDSSVNSKASNIIIHP